jgi:phosphoglycolate phosphatase-like HAD superfamily hydrolase
MQIVFFDIDGTLILSGGAGKAALEAALASEFGIGWEIEKLSLSGRTDRAIVRDMLLWHGLADSVENWQRMTAAYIRHLPAHLAQRSGNVLPGIEALLARLNLRPRTAVGLLTGNTREGARLKLGHFGLAGYFPFGGFGDEHLDRDSVAREALAEARRLHGNVRPEQIWVVGDTPLDVQCARHIGARAVAVATGWHSLDELTASEPDVLVTDLADPQPLLRLLG